MSNKKAIIIGCGIAGPAMAIYLKRIGVEATIYEAQPHYRDDAGAFLGISPNGLNVLRELAPLEKVLAEYTPGRMSFYNSRNKNIGWIDNAGQKELYGAETVQVKRGLLNQVIRQAALEAGIQIELGKKLKSILQHADKSVTAFFEDGTQATADFLIGCDGIHSSTRKNLFPDAPGITYTGLLSTGGFTHWNNGSDLSGSIRMTFGEKAFFAYVVSNTGEVWWFNNIAWPKEPGRYELSEIEQAQLKSSLLEMHRNDPDPIAALIESARSIEVYPIYDIPFLPKWHQGSVCLIGDAAHATAPHIGQGAALALEDTLVLAKCLRDLPTLETAFEKFQSMRQERVQKIIRGARKVGDSKTAPNKIQQWFRDMLLPVFVKQQARKLDWVYSYKVNWNDKIVL